MEIAGKVVIITGASDGIGAECARVLSRRGAKLVLNARQADKLRLVAPEASPEIVAGDITDPAVRERLAASAIARFGRIDILINNAGVGLYKGAWLATEQETRSLLELNFFAALEMTRLVVPPMRAQRSGMIVNIGSIAGKIVLPWFTLYSVSKYALGALTEGLRMELRDDNIHAMIVCPGYVGTQFQSHVLAGEVPERVHRSRSLKISVNRCAEDIVKGIEKNKRTVLTPKAGWLLVAASRLMPGIVQAQLRRMNTR